MKKTNVFNLFFTTAVSILFVACGGSTEYDTSKDFTKLEGNSNPSFEQKSTSNVKEVDILAEQYRLDQANKSATNNTSMDNTNTSSNDKNTSNDINSVNDDPNKKIETMPETNPSIPPVVNNNIPVVPKGEVNVVVDSNINQ